MHNPALIGHHRNANGWTASVIAHGYNGPGTYEVWAFHEDGRGDPDVQGWLAESAVRAFLAEVAARP